MKSNLWFSRFSRFAALLAGAAWLAGSSAWAQESSRESGATNAVRRPAGVAKSVLVDPPGNGTVKPESLTVRSEPNFSGDVLCHVHRGEVVTVYEQLSLTKPKPNEPTNWARVGLPTNAAVWVAAEYVDTNTMTVSARRINVRGGPSDNYTIICRMEKGTPIKEIRRASDWIQIEPPTNAFGYVAAEYLTIEAGPAKPAVAEVTTPVVTTTPPVLPANHTPVNTMSNTVGEAAIAIPTNTVTPTNTTVAMPENTSVNNIPTNTVTAAESTNVITAPDPSATMTATPTNTTTVTPPAAVATAAVTPATPAVTSTTTPAATPTLTPVAVPTDTGSADAKPRVITREGILHRAINIQAPADFELHDIRSGDVIEYVQPDPKDKNFKKYAGTHVLMSGSEWVDRRWPKVPILKVETIDVLP